MLFFLREKSFSAQSSIVLFYVYFSCGKKETFPTQNIIVLFFLRGESCLLYVKRNESCLPHLRDLFLGSESRIYAKVARTESVGNSLPRYIANTILIYRHRPVEFVFSISRTRCISHGVNNAYPNPVFGFISNVREREALSRLEYRATTFNGHPRESRRYESPAFSGLRSLSKLTQNTEHFGTMPWFKSHRVLADW